VVGVVITVVMAVALFVFCIVWETVKVVKSFWAFLDGLIDMCLPDRFMRD
jgi:phage-related protein